MWSQRASSHLLWLTVPYLSRIWMKSNKCMVTYPKVTGNLLLKELPCHSHHSPCQNCIVGVIIIIFVLYCYCPLHVSSVMFLLCAITAILQVHCTSHCVLQCVRLFNISFEACQIVCWINNDMSPTCVNSQFQNVAKQKGSFVHLIRITDTHTVMENSCFGLNTATFFLWWSTLMWDSPKLLSV